MTTRTPVRLTLTRAEADTLAQAAETALAGWGAAFGAASRNSLNRALDKLAIARANSAARDAEKGRAA